MHSALLKRINMCEPDSDVVRWRLNFLDVDQLFSSSYYGESTQHDVNICHERYIRGDDRDNEFDNVENDEIIAHSLQQELLQLSVAEGTDSSDAVDQHYQSSIGSHDWYTHSAKNYHYGNEGSLQGTADVGPSSSCSSPGDRSYDGEDFSYTLEITDESELDGEVGKRLNQINAVPHVPKINGDVPSIDEATSDHQRLLDRLQSYNLVESKVQGDGNCQFRALSDQFYRTPEHHKFVRRQIVNQLKSHPEMYEGYVPMTYGDYLKKMSKRVGRSCHIAVSSRFVWH